MIFDGKNMEINLNKYKKINFENHKNNNNTFNILRILIIFFIINLTTNIYLIYEREKNKELIKELNLFYNDFKYINDKTDESLNNFNSSIEKNKDLIGYILFFFKGKILFFL